MTKHVCSFRSYYPLLSLLLLAAVTVGVMQLKPAVPTVEHTWPETVKRGDIFFLYRPAVGKEEPKGLIDVPRLSDESRRVSRAPR